MATIYSGIEGINPPTDLTDFQKYNRLCEAYVKRVIHTAKQMNPSCPEAGEEVTFPVADGTARYIVLALKPLQLVHLDIYDGYQFTYANRLTAKDIKNNIARDKALRKIFTKER